MKGGDDARKMWGEVGKMVSGECGVMGPRGVTGGVGGDTERLLEDSLCNSPTPEAQMNKEHCRRGGRSLHLKVGIQVQVQMEPQTWTPSVLEVVHVSSSGLVYEHSATGHRNMVDESRSCQS